MTNKKLQRLLAVSAVSFSCLWLSVVPINKAWAQTSRQAEISTYIQQLKNSDGEIDLYAVIELRKIGAEAVPALVKTLKSKDRILRMGAIYALKNIYAFGNIGVEAKAAVTALIAALKDNDESVRWSAADALGRMGKAAVPALIAALKDNNKDVRYWSANALGSIGVEAKAAVPALIVALKDNDKYVRWRAADALGSIGVEAKAAVPALIVALKDNDEYVRSSASNALGRIEVEDKTAVSALIATLKDNDESVRWSAANALVSISATYLIKAGTMPIADLEQGISNLEKALPVLKGIQNKDLKLDSQIASINGSLAHLKKMRQLRN